jgi:hypothetical protein
MPTEQLGVQIGRVSSQTGIGLDTIRFYERIEPADVVVEDNRWLLTLP